MRCEPIERCAIIQPMASPQTTSSAGPAANPGELGGISLEQHAGVTAALAEGFSLAEVLEVEELDPVHWPAADTAWKARLAADGASGGALFATYRNRVHEAEDSLARRTAPVDEDLEAWLGFLHIWSSTAAPALALERLGLGLNDVSRLQRKWARRMAEDEELEKTAAKLRERGPSPLGELSVGPRELKPFPWSKRRLAGSSKAAPPPSRPPSSGLIDTALGLHGYAAVMAELARTPADKDRVFARHGVAPEAREAAEQRWKARLDGNPELQRDLKQLIAHQAARLDASPRGGAPVPTRPSERHDENGNPQSPTASSLSTPPLEPSQERDQNVVPTAVTAPTLDVPRGKPLPFAPARVAQRPPSHAPSPPAGPSRDAVTGTALAHDRPKSAALPFPSPSSSPLGETAPVFKRPGPTLPFSEPSAAGNDPAPGAPRSAEIRAPERGAGVATKATGNEQRGAEPQAPGETAPVLDVPRGADLPFLKPKRPAEPALTEEEQAAHACLSATSLTLQLPRELLKAAASAKRPAVPPAAERTDSSRAPARASTAAPPPASSPVPPLTIEQYASLCVDLLAASDKTAEVLARYRLTPDAKRSLDAHYRERFAASPAAREAWESARRAYESWLRSTSGKR